MVDLALISDDMFSYDPKIKELVQVYSSRIQFMKRTHLYQNTHCLHQLATYDTKCGGQGSKGEISLQEGIIGPLRKMMLSSEMGNLEIYEHLEKIDRYLQDEDSVIKLLYFLPLHRQGLGVIAEGLYSSNTEIAGITAKILMKIQKCEIGQMAVSFSLNTFHLLKLSEICQKQQGMESRVLG